MNKILLTFIILIGIGLPATAFGLNLELREYKNRVCYDGDTCYLLVPQFPEKLRKMSVRIKGIDTTEIRGDCEKEKKLALEGRVFANKVFLKAKNIEFKNLQWDKYGGRLLADVYLDGNSYADMIMKKNLARPYDGGKKEGWCN